MKKICVVTATRAEYGLLKPVIKRLTEDFTLELQLVVTGMHLSPEFGYTYKEIEDDGFYINEKIEIQMSSDTKVGISKTMGLAIIGFAECFDRLEPDMVLVLGDRYETFAVATVAAMAAIPIAHISGGDTTTGALDEFIRHSITKMSYLHFPTTEIYRKRVIQLGENPDRVFNVGSTGVESIKQLKLLSKEEFERSIDFKINENKSALVTFHPVTLENNSSQMQFEQLLRALDQIAELKIIFTKANSDIDGRIINKMIDRYVSQHPSKAIAYTSLGQLRYLSAIKTVDIVIGNSSSGIVEVPSFAKPTINIGDRQKGRVKAESIIDCGYQKEDIISAVHIAFGSNFQRNLKNIKNPYEGENPSENIVQTIKDFLQKNKINLKKKFYDL